MLVLFTHICCMTLYMRRYRTFYAQQVQEWLARENMSASDYIQRAELVLKEENTRIAAHLSGDIVPLLQQVQCAFLLYLVICTYQKGLCYCKSS